MNLSALRRKLNEIVAIGWPDSFPQISGVYAIVNKRTGRTYIGSSQNLQHRFIGHRSSMRKGYHQNKGLSADVASSGYEGFAAGVIVECPISELIVREHQLINLLEIQDRYNTQILTEQQAKAQSKHDAHPSARIHMFLTEQLIAKLQEHSTQTGLTVSDLIRRAIEQFLKKEAK